MILVLRMKIIVKCSNQDSKLSMILYPALSVIMHLFELEAILKLMSTHVLTDDKLNELGYAFHINFSVC